LLIAAAIMKYKAVICDGWIVLYATNCNWVDYKLQYVFFGSYKPMRSDIRYIFAAKTSWDPLLRIHVCTKSIIKE
jgi:hypothetical protein